MSGVISKSYTAADKTMLRESYKSVTKASGDSVRAGWRFGQLIDSFSDRYTRAQIAEMIGISQATVYRYHRLYSSFQRPELATELAETLETWNLDLLVTLNPIAPVRGRPLAGRHWRNRCTGCGGTEIAREEYEPEELAAAGVSGPE